MHFDGLLAAVGLWHGAAPDVVTFLDVGGRGLVDGHDHRVVGELERHWLAVGSLHEQRVTVGPFDRAVQALRLLLCISRRSGKQRHDGGASQNS